MIITAKFRKDYTSIQNFCMACRFYIRAIISTGSCTADGRCEPLARERREHVARVLPDETKTTY